MDLFSRKKHGQENIRATLGFWKLIWFDLKVKSLFLERVSGIARAIYFRVKLIVDHIFIPSVSL